MPDGGLLLPGLLVAGGGPREVDPHDPINRDLLGFWPLDEGGGPIANDISNWRSRGALNGSPSRIVGPRGRAISLNGSSQYIAASRRQEFGGFSAVAWVNLSASAGWDNAILSSMRPFDDTILWQIDNGTGMRFWANTAVSNASSGAFTDIRGRWACVGVSWAPGRTTRFYLDGRLIGSGTTAGDIQSSVTGWHVGRYGVPGNRYFNGAARLVRTLGRVLTDREFRRLANEEWAGTVSPEEKLFHAVRLGTTAVSVSVTGIALAASAGSVTEGIALAASGSAISGAAGTLSSAIAEAVTGGGATSSAGSATGGIAAGATGTSSTASPGSVAGALGAFVAGAAAAAAATSPTSAIGMSVAGAEMTVSAGSLAYGIGFILTGAASAASAGTLSLPGNAARSLTGIRMTALPGNVRVTGGTRWTPQEPRAETVPAALGNTLQPPPRATGNATADLQALTQWANTMYDQMVKVQNVIGRVNDHEDRIGKLEQE